MITLRGLLLVRPHGTLIAQGLKKAVVKSRRFRIEDEPLFLVEDGRVLGVLVLGEPKPIDLEDFRRLRRVHRVSEEERRRWWPEHRELWLYPVRSFQPLSMPYAVDVPRGVQTIIREVSVPPELLPLGAWQDSPD